MKILCVLQFISACSGTSPPLTTIFLIFLIFEGMLFGIFTGIMFGTQMSAVCTDETVSVYHAILNIPKKNDGFETTQGWIAL